MFCQVVEHRDFTEPVFADNALFWPLNPPFWALTVLHSFADAIANHKIGKKIAGYTNTPI